MPRRHLPLLDFEATVSADTARQDKIEINIALGSIRGESYEEVLGEAESFLHFLGSPPVGLHEPDAYGRIFNRPQRTNNQFENQDIRKRATVNQPLPPPLFRGELRVHNPRNREPVWSFDVLLSLNLNRFLRRQRFPSPTRQLLLDNPPFQYSFYGSEVPSSLTNEVALIGDDNWIPDERLWMLYAGQRFWSRHLRHYVEGSVREVLADVTRVDNQLSLSLEQPARNPFSLWSVEHYWDFYSDDPLGTVRMLEPLLRSFAASRLDAREYPLTIPIEGNQNSRRLLLQINNGTTLRIYAKTNRRVRFEVVHTLNHIRVPGGHTFPTIDGVFPLLERLANQAARQINEVFRHFRLRSSAPQNECTVLQFIFAFQAACGDPETALTLLGILTNNLTLVVGHGIELGRTYRPALNRLVNRGILTRSNNCYSLMPQYHRALTDMYNRGIGFLLGTRRRRRPQ